MYGCELLFDAETAVVVRREISAAMGGECPCEADGSCPLLPRDLGPLLDPRVGVLNTREEPVASAESAPLSGPRLPIAG